MSSEDRNNPTVVRQAAAHHLAGGRRVIPVPAGAKGVVLTGWTTLEIGAADLDDHFPPGKDMNLGLVLGRASGGLVDVDLDCVEAVRAAPAMLPHTDMVHGRPGNPSSHWWYRVEATGDIKTRKFQGTDRGMIVEVRGDGAQTLVPPSTHPDGERYAWERGGEPAVMPLERLYRDAGWRRPWCWRGRGRRRAAGMTRPWHWPAGWPAPAGRKTRLRA